MSELQITATLTLHDGKLDEFKSVATECIASVRAKDEGTLQYDWFFSEDQSKCVVRERYKDSDALLQHIKNLGDLLGRLLALCDLSVDVFGNPSKELVNATASIPTTIYSHFASA